MAAVVFLAVFCNCLYAAADKDYYVGAYYYPWFAGNNFHGGHTLIEHLSPPQMPELGWYDQTDPAVISQHYKWARYAGIDYFVCSYWGRQGTENSILPQKLHTK